MIIRWSLEATASAVSLRFAAANRIMHRLRKCSSGVTLIEFALILPILIVVLLMGTELAYYASVRLQVNQIAVSLADNASRLGQTDNAAVVPSLTEGQVDSVMFGAMEQGTSIDLEQNGRVILSSLERDPGTGRQWFHWQRCRGDLSETSAYGPQGYGQTGATLAGVGKAGTPLQATGNSSVMVAEVYYEYQPLFSLPFLNDAAFREEAVFQIRDDRDLGPGISSGTSNSLCNS